LRRFRSGENQERAAASRKHEIPVIVTETACEVQKTNGKCIKADRRDGGIRETDGDFAGTPGGRLPVLYGSFVALHEIPALLRDNPASTALATAAEIFA
jgi:hypothetical protein